MALATQRAALESLLRARKLDTTLTSAHPLQQPAQREQLLPFGPPALEDALLGGLPRGQVSEIAGGISSGRTSLLVSLLARAVKAAGLALSSGVFTLVVLDVADMPVRLLRGLPFTTWMRLHRLIAGSDTACVLVTPQPLGRSAGGASIRLEPQAGALSPFVERGVTFHERVHASRRPFVGIGRHEAAAARAGLWHGTGPVPRRFRGLAVQAHVQAGLHATTCTLELTPCSSASS